jgi:hypothetical protein
MTRHPPLSDDDKARIIRLYTVERLGTDKIGPMFGRAGGTICDYLERWGIPRRAQGNPMIHTCWTRRTQRRRNLGGAAGEVTKAAATFTQPSLIQLPPHLQAEFEACVAEVRAERGSAASQAKWGF